jgi:hypothetical protein
MASGFSGETAKGGSIHAQGAQLSPSATGTPTSDFQDTVSYAEPKPCPTESTGTDSPVDEAPPPIDISEGV